MGENKITSCSLSENIDIATPLIGKSTHINTNKTLIILFSGQVLPLTHCILGRGCYQQTLVNIALLPSDSRGQRSDSYNTRDLNHLLLRAPNYHLKRLYRSRSRSQFIILRGCFLWSAPI